MPVRKRRILRMGASFAGRAALISLVVPRQAAAIVVMFQGGVALAMAAIAGGHFLPYAWLQRSQVYVGLAVAVSAGALMLQIGLGREAFPVILAWMTACYWVAAPLVYRRAAALTGRT